MALCSRQVPGNLASFLKQASVDTAMAMLQQREATPPTPIARQLAGQGGGAVWPFGAAGLPHQAAMGPGGQAPDPRLSALGLQSSPLRSAFSCLAELVGSYALSLQFSSIDLKGILRRISKSNDELLDARQVSHSEDVLQTGKSLGRMSVGPISKHSRVEMAMGGMHCS